MHKRAEENMTIPNTDVTGGQGGTKRRLEVGGVESSCVEHTAGVQDVGLQG